MERGIREDDIRDVVCCIPQNLKILVIVTELILSGVKIQCPRTRTLSRALQSPSIRA